MKYLKSLFASLEWWKLRPAQYLLAEQPGATDPTRFVAVAKADNWLLAYMPVGGEIKLRTEGMKPPLAARWFNPRTGAWSQQKAALADTSSLRAPDINDWVLWVGPMKTPASPPEN